MQISAVIENVHVNKTLKIGIINKQPSSKLTIRTLISIIESITKLNISINESIIKLELSITLWKQIKRLTIIYKTYC